MAQEPAGWDQHSPEYPYGHAEHPHGEAGLERALQGRWWPCAAPCPGFFKELRALSVVSWRWARGTRGWSSSLGAHPAVPPAPGSTAVSLSLRGCQHPKAAPSLQEGRGMRRCSLPFSASLPCSASGVVKQVRNLGRKTKGWDGFLKLLQKSLLMKARGKGLFSHSQHGGRFAAGLLHSCVWASPSLTRGLGTRHLSSSSLL